MLNYKNSSLSSGEKFTLTDNPGQRESDGSAGSTCSGASLRLHPALQPPRTTLGSASWATAQLWWFSFFGVHESQPWEASPARCPAWLPVPLKREMPSASAEGEAFTCLPPYPQVGRETLLYLSHEQRFPQGGNAQALSLLFSVTAHSPNKAFPPFTSPFLLAQAP